MKPDKELFIRCAFNKMCLHFTVPINKLNTCGTSDSNLSMFFGRKIVEYYVENTIRTTEQHFFLLLLGKQLYLFKFYHLTLHISASGSNQLFIPGARMRKWLTVFHIYFCKNEPPCYI